MDRLIRPLGLLAVLQLGVHTLAWACSCAEPPPVADAFANADQVASQNHPCRNQSSSDSKIQAVRPRNRTTQ
jgi:hypothetical protein